MRTYGRRRCSRGFTARRTVGRIEGVTERGREFVAECRLEDGFGVGAIVVEASKVKGGRASVGAGAEVGLFAFVLAVLRRHGPREAGPRP